MGIFVSVWQRHEDIDTRSFQLSFFNSFFTHTIFVCSKQSSTVKVFMQMAPSLTSPFLGFRHFRKLVQPLLIGHDRCLSHGGPASGATGPIGHSPGRGSVDLFPTSVQTVLFQEGDRHMPIAPSSQRRLRLLSGTPQRAMEPLEIATGFSSWEKVPAAQKHFVVMLSGATQLHLGGEPTFALQQPSLQLG